MMAISFGLPSPDVFAGGLTLETLTYEYHPINTPYYVHTHLYNTESGVVLDPNTINCSFHLYGENVNWQHILNNGTLEPVGIGLSTTINESYFTESGDYAILLWCEEPLAQPSKTGGFIKYYFTVYEDEKNFNYFFELVGIIAIILLVAVAIILKQSIIGIISSIGVIIYGITLFSSSTLFGVVVLIGGLLLALYFGLLQET